jgi:uncharacterized protein YgbK (DUF1537 family)
VIANAVEDRDAEVVALAAAVVESERPIVARTAAGYVRARAGQRHSGVLGPSTVRVHAGPGLVIVGSHVMATTRQLAALLADPPATLELIEVPAAAAANARGSAELVRSTVAAARAALDRGAVPVVATSRELLAPAAHDPTGLRLARRISRLLAAVVRELEPRPAWIVSKGGITSSDVASVGLGARRARVVGPVLPGVPLWRVRRRGGSVPLVVFPGNVGGDDALREAVAILVGAATRG